MIIEELIAGSRSDILTVLPEHSVLETARLFGQKRIGVIVVCSNDGLIEGVVSLGDLAFAIGQNGAEVVNRPVKEIMTKDVISCQPTDDIETAINKMNDLGVRHLPVVENGRVVDVVSHRRALEVLYKGAALDFAQLRSYVFKSGGRY